MTTPPAPQPPVPPTFQARYFDGLTSRERVASAHATLTHLHVQSDGLEVSFALNDVTIEPPLSGHRRVLKLPGRARLETDDDAAVSALERQLRRNTGLSLVRRLEARPLVALASLVFMLLFLAGFVRYGLPALASGAASVTPLAVLSTLDAETVNAIDARYLKPTHLPAARQQALTREFAAMAKEQGGPYTYRLLFRDGGDLVGANAFALPGGTVFMTDQLVSLARDDRELLGVLAHELGHVRHRHAMRQIYQSVGLTLAFSVVAGDVTSAASVAAAVPALLLTSGYSREAETQADDDAGRWLMQRYGATTPLQDILRRLIEQDDDRPTSRVLDLLASHPGEQQRLAHLRAIQKNWKTTAP